MVGDTAVGTATWHGGAVYYHGGVYYRNNAWHGGYYGGGYNYNNSYRNNNYNNYQHNNYNFRNRNNISGNTVNINGGTAGSSSFGQGNRSEAGTVPQLPTVGDRLVPAEAQRRLAELAVAGNSGLPARVVRQAAAVVADGAAVAVAVSAMESKTGSTGRPPMDSPVVPLVRC